MYDYIPISTLNDFVFCPYSIYLHNVYMGSDDELFKATPQTRGKSAHKSIDDKTYSTKKSDIVALSIYSDELGIAGKIDTYKADSKLLIERKYQLNQIYRGQIYQLWAQYFCMKEMGYEVDELAFYSISTNKMFPVALPSDKDKQEFIGFIDKFKHFDPEMPIEINLNKCVHCIYCNLCDKVNIENVYA